MALPGAAEIAARNKQGLSDPVEAPTQDEKMASSPTEKLKAVPSHHGIDHLSAPPSALHSGTASPAPERAEADATKPQAGSEILERPEEEDKNAEHHGVLKGEGDDGAMTQRQGAEQASDAGTSVEN